MTKILSWILATFTLVIFLAASLFFASFIDLREFSRPDKLSKLDQEIKKIEHSNFDDQKREIEKYAIEVRRKIKNNKARAQKELKNEKTQLEIEKRRLEKSSRRTLAQRILSGDMSINSIAEEKYNLFVVNEKIALVARAIKLSHYNDTEYSKAKNKYDDYERNRKEFNDDLRDGKEVDSEKINQEKYDYDVYLKKYKKNIALAAKNNPIYLTRTRLEQGRHRITSALHDIKVEISNAPSSFFFKLVKGISANLWKALSLLLSAIASFIAWKIFNFYVLSRLARKGSPLVKTNNISTPTDDGNAPVPICSKAEEVSLATGQVLYVRGKYIKSEPGCTSAGFKTILDWHCPLTCLSAGLVSLSVYRDTSAGPVVLVPRESAVGTLLRLRLSADENLCIAARNLVAIVTPHGASPRFRKVWKLATAHSWLSFQFRYLLVSGPCDVFLEGSHSLIANQVTSSRQVESGSAVAFSGKLAVGAERTSSFGAYLFGTRPLFEEVYSGNNGVLVHQHVIHIDGYSPSNKGGFWRTTADVLLKLVGI